MEWEVLASGYQLVEAPTLEPDGSLLFSDVLGGGIHRLGTDGRVATVVPKRRGVGGIALHADGGIVCSGRDVVHVNKGETRVVLHVDDVAGWNDIATDPAGRVYAGALRFAVFDPDAEVVPGALWCVDPDIGPWAVFGDLIHANGIALSPDQLTIYASDSRARSIVMYDLTTEKRTDVDVSTHGVPDGMAVDDDGCLWVALVGGGVGRFRPDGTLDTHLQPPSNFVTSVCFDDRNLVVTTGDNAQHADLGGCILRTQVDVAGARPPVARV
jgi:gluconolactonase